jgi:hypothetical protein
VSRLRDCLHDTPWYARKVAVPVRNAAYRATRPLRTVQGRVGNWRRERFLRTGKGYASERATRGVRSSLPVYRDRINPATSRPRSDDAEIYRRRDLRLERARQGGTFDPARAWERSDDACRSIPAASRQQAADRAEVRGVLARSREADRARVAAHADAVLGPGRAARAEEALRQARHNPWEDRQPSQRGGSR